MVEIHFAGKSYIFEDDDDFIDLLDENADEIKEEYNNQNHIFWY